MHDLKTYFRQFSFLSEKEIDEQVEKVIPKTLSKDEFFLSEGSVCDKVAFVKSGIFRSFYHTSTEEQITYCFRFPGTFITGYSSLLTGEPTRENLQALTDAELLVIPKEEITRLENASPSWLRFFKMVAEYEYIELEKRIFLLQKESAEFKYRELLEKSPNYLREIPLHHLASYLGITQRHLSRIRKNIGN